MARHRTRWDSNLPFNFVLLLLFSFYAFTANNLEDHQTFCNSMLLFSIFHVNKKYFIYFWFEYTIFCVHISLSRSLCLLFLTFVYLHDCSFCLHIHRLFIADKTAVQTIVHRHLNDIVQYFSRFLSLRLLFIVHTHTHESVNKVCVCFVKLYGMWMSVYARPWSISVSMLKTDEQNEWFSWKKVKIPAK